MREGLNDHYRNHRTRLFTLHNLKQGESFMRKKSAPVNDFSELRSEAENLLREKQVKIPDSTASAAEMMRMVHELEVHQIELEMQQKELVQTRDELEKSLKQSTDLYDFAPLGYMTIARNSSILNVNLMAAKMLGIERSRLLDRQLSDFILAEDRSAFTAFIDQVFKSGALKCCEVLRLDKTEGKAQAGPGAGNVKPLTVSIDAVVSENGDECQVILSDISRLKEIEHAMLDTNERLQFIMDATFSGTWEWDLETNRQIWSDNVWSALESFGLEPLSREASYELWKELMVPEDREKIEKIVPAAMIKEEEFTLEWRVRDSSGRDHWVMSKGIPLKKNDDRVTRYGGILTDITELKKAQEISNKTQTLNKTIIDSIPGPFHIIDRKGFYAGWNAYDRDIIAGKPESEMANMQVIATVHPEDRARVQEKIASVLEHGIDVHVEARILLRGGPEFRWFVMSARKVIIDGNPFLIGIGTDITERKKIEDVQLFLSHTSYVSQDEPFFNALARYLAECLDLDFVSIDILEGNNQTARTLAIWCDGHFEDNEAYSLKDTPCGNVVRKDFCCYPANVRQLFPGNQVLQDLQAESYVGVTLRDHSGQPIGLIAVIGRLPLADHKMAEAILKMVSVRAAGELERLLNEEALRESEKKYRDLFESVPIGLYQMTLDGKMIATNQAGLDICKCPASDRNAWFDQDTRRLYVYPEDRARFRDTLLKHGSVSNFEAEFFRMDGTTAWFSNAANIERGENGRPDLITGSFVDITKRKHAEDELKKLSTAITQSPAIVVITDPRRKYRICESGIFSAYRVQP